jgi:NhaP-type Na+/H+ or K+/H+ antiporter
MGILLLILEKIGEVLLDVLLTKLVEWLLRKADRNSKHTEQEEDS